ncbi:MAG TPA: GNAT family N-acetyltransferase [Gaiellaceae bacterium]|nr:GNAT family N-acetyltransferase [Gaiellaceae bacterium]
MTAAEHALVADPAAVRAAPEELSVTSGAGPAGLALLDARWDELVAQQDLPAPTSGAAWLQALAAADRGRPFVATAEAGGRLVAGGAFSLRTPKAAPRPVVATWLGTEPFWYSPELLVDPELPRAGVAILDEVLARADLVHVAAASDGPTAAALLERLPWAKVEPGAEGWILPLPPPRLEHAEAKAAYTARRAERLGAKLEVRRWRDAVDVAPALERLFELHEARWRGRSDAIPSFSSTRETTEWHRAVIAAAARLQRARIVEVWEDGILVASVLGLLHGRGSLFHTMAIRPGGRLRGPGHLVLLELAKELHAAGAAGMDLGWGAGEPDGPKARLGPRRVEVVRLLAARSRRMQRPLEQALRLRGRASRTARRHA